MMFWGWYSFGDGRTRRGGGCFFLPLFLLCGSFYMFGGDSSLLIPLLLAVVLWWAVSSMMRSRVEHDTPYLDEKPKRGREVIIGDDGELIDIEDDDRANSRYD
jgi:hypothetical protein